MGFARIIVASSQLACCHFCCVLMLVAHATYFVSLRSVTDENGYADQYFVLFSTRSRSAHVLHDAHAPPKYF